MQISGVFTAKKKDGTAYFRASVTFKEKHISLGSFETEEAAGASYALASEILRGDKEYLPEDYEKICGKSSLSFDKWVMLVNLRNTGMYCKNPIYLYGKYFDYYLDRSHVLKFTADELFFFRNHRIQKRGGHLFYSDFGMQCSLLARYGVRSFAVENRDYFFKNGDSLDFRFGNLIIINQYVGVMKKEDRGRVKFDVVIHMEGNVSVGTYSSEVEGAVAYNKAADAIEEKIRTRENEKKAEKQSTNVENKMLGKQTFTSTNCMNDSKEEKKCADYSGSTETNFESAVSIRDGGLSSGAKGARNGIKKYRKWQRNYIESISKREYLELYEKVKFKKSFRRYLEKL